ncbi:MAG: hypothetical protein R3B72_34945 [Polyangiaceae bacterium]
MVLPRPLALLALLALGLGLLAASACTPPVAPSMVACEDDYRPAMCLDGEEVCETDDNGCRVCTCDTGD